jgi:hypothetical protein
MTKKQRKHSAGNEVSFDHMVFIPSDELVDQVLSELNISMANQIPSKSSTGISKT